MALWDKPAQPLALVHWIVATLLADVIAAAIFVAWLYGPLFFGDGAVGLGVLPPIVTPYVLGALLPSFWLVHRTWRKQLETIASVWFGVLMAALTAIAMALYASYLTGEGAGEYLLKVFTVQLFTLVTAGALSGAGTWYYLNWVRSGTMDGKSNDAEKVA